MSNKYVTIETSKGEIVAELFDRDCPDTVTNFQRLAGEGFYDHTAVHAVHLGRILEAGDPLSRELEPGDARLGTGGPGWTIRCEYVGNRRRHEEGALTMITEGPDTGGSRFGIVLDPEGLPERNGSHTVFGQIEEGLEVAKALEVGDRLEVVRVWE